MNFFERYIRLSPAEKDPSHFPETVMGTVLDVYRLDRWRWNTFIAVSTLCSVFEPIVMLLLGRLTEGIMGGGIPPEGVLLNPYFIGMVVAVLFGLTLSDMIWIVMQNLIINPKLAQRSRYRAMNRIAHQSMEFFNNDMAGRISAKIFDFGRAASDLMITAIGQTWYVVAFFTSTLLIAFSLHAILGGLLFAWGLCAALAIRFAVPQIVRESDKLTESYSTALGRCVDIISNIALTKLFSKPDAESAGFLHLLNRHLSNAYLKQKVVTVWMCILYLINGVFVAILAGAVLWLWSRDEIAAGGIITLLPLVFRVRLQFEWMLNQASMLSENYGTIQNALEVLNRPILVQDKPNSPALPAVRGDIAFENVRFTYPSGREIFPGLSLTIPPGQKVGLVGPSGAGKTTLVQLLLRFHDVQSGAIRIDGHDIAGVTQDSLRRQIGMVTQEPALLNRSVRENLIYGSKDAGEDDMIAAAKQAAAHDFILHLRDREGRTGYDAHVGERGVKLSGGQRQRIAIARLILKNAPIMLLDEATSALDSEVEAVIQEQIYPLMKGKTVIAIAHRLSTVMQMDRLLVLDQGRIVEDGPHADLLDQDGLYARLWARQSEGFLPE